MAIKVDDVMTRPVKTVAPETSIADAARLMFDLDAGALPVSDKGQLVGMLTDRDLAVRAVAQGLGSDTPVGKVMTINVS